MVLACHNIQKSFGTNVIIKAATFYIEDKEKAAIVGINGCGKSTLLKMIMNYEQPNYGEIILSKGKTIGYLQQHPDLSGNRTIYEEFLEEKRPIIEMEQRLRAIEEEMKHSKGKELTELLNSYARLNHTFELQNGYAYQSEINGVIKGLGFEEGDFNKPIDTLSGGQKTRVALGKLLLSKPDILLLDEPINHLDLQSIAWLETFLLNYGGAVVIIAHDRYFLNKITSKIIEIDNGEVTVFSGNYSSYADKKAQLRKAITKRYLNQQRNIKHQEEVIAKLKSFNREKSIKRAESREKMLEKIDVLEKPTETDAKMKLALEPCVLSGTDVLTVSDLSKSYPQSTQQSICLFRDVSLMIKRGEKVAVIGENGTGKTTFLKIINGMVQADSGSVTIGSQVNIGYYDQEHHVLHLEKTIFDEIADTYPRLTQTKIRNVLAAFLFTDDDVFHKIETLSGGERGRVSLAKLMLSEANFLILDEPTNHLDMISKEILENALKQYTGTVLYVSHDRYFINETATRILDLKDRTFTNYIGNYDYYLEKKEVFATINTKPERKLMESENISSVKLSWQQQKELQAKQRKIETDLKNTESSIHLTEQRISEIDELLAHPDVYTNVEKCTGLSEEKTLLIEQLELLYEKWELLAEEA